jgi:hypothetical protein
MLFQMCQTECGRLDPLHPLVLLCVLLDHHSCQYSLFNPESRIKVSYLAVLEQGRCLLTIVDRCQVHPLLTCAPATGKRSLPKTLPPPSIYTVVPGLCIPTCNLQGHTSAHPSTRQVQTRWVRALLLCMIEEDRPLHNAITMSLRTHSCGRHQ